MGILKKQYQVKPNTIGYLYKDNIFEQKLNPGYYEIWDWKNRTELFVLPETSKLLTVTNQEVLTKDNVALRFSFNVLYKIIDGQKFLNNFALDKTMNAILQEGETRIFNIVQIYFRNKLAELDSEIVNKKRSELSEFNTDEMLEEVSKLGISIEQAQIRDLTFPKSIQELFAKHLESKIRAKSELENARTAVATARALKNASELMKDDENIKFFQMIETITKIANKGKHTFMIGDINQLTKK
ncbi:slipin family protein [Flammeovirga aprica]|uniref:Slipin family protein n=1 Tax=Flammeovirga aprica JL-4 TaxID=694437 RepID=A0A7X9P433_9BACT|nr:slipin family protein [Flammeovirga aprica]NME68594.1 slipin family protein [Flammeovirga aprica JL-4]